MLEVGPNDIKDLLSGSYLSPNHGSPLIPLS